MQRGRDGLVRVVKYCCVVSESERGVKEEEKGYQEDIYLLPRLIYTASGVAVLTG